MERALGGLTLSIVATHRRARARLRRPGQASASTRISVLPRHRVDPRRPTPPPGQCRRQSAELPIAVAPSRSSLWCRATGENSGVRSACRPVVVGSGDRRGDRCPGPVHAVAGDSGSGAGSPEERPACRRRATHRGARGQLEQLDRASRDLEDRLRVARARLRPGSTGPARAVAPDGHGDAPVIVEHHLDALHTAPVFLAVRGALVAAGAAQLDHFHARNATTGQSGLAGSSGYVTHGPAPGGPDGGLSGTVWPGPQGPRVDEALGNAGKGRTGG